MRCVTARRRLLRFLLLAIVVYGGLVAALVIGESASLYRPFPGPTEPADAGLPHYTRRTLANGNQPAIVYWENHAPNDAPTILYFHGNGGGLHLHWRSLAFLDAQHMHVIGMEYPGFPSAPGSPSEPLIMQDARTLYDAVQARESKPIIIWGYSLGTGVAVQLAAARQPRAVILEAPFTAVVDRAAEIFPWAPVHYLMRNTYLSRDYIGQIHAPLLVMHGTLDRIIPIAHGRALFARANEPKTWREYKGAGHLDLITFGADADAVAFIRAAPAPNAK